MGDRVFEWTVGCIIASVLVTFVWQWVWGQYEEVKVWGKLSKVRSLPHGYEECGTISWAAQNAGLALQRKRLRLRARTLPKGEIQAFRWDVEREYWEREAGSIRQSFLVRTQATADKWRNVFAGLLAVFGAVLFVKPALPQGESMQMGLYLLIIVALVLAAQAVAYTGWASAGLPKMLVDVTASTAFVEQTSQAARSLVRLRVGLIMGGTSAIALILAVATVLSS